MSADASPGGAEEHQGEERLADLFGRLGIVPAAVEHPPVHTVEEALVHGP